MHTPAHTIEMYLRAKDLNRPHLMEHAFTDAALLQMEVRQGGMNFPPRTEGREAIADTLVRNFGRIYDNVYTFCLAEAPDADCSSFDCSWLVVMTEKDSRAARVGCGQYRWRFAADNRLAQELQIVIEAMHTLPAADAPALMAWAGALDGPWCPLQQALATAPSITAVQSVMQMLATADVDAVASAS